MKNKRIHFVYVPDINNCGDYNSCPLDYFKNDFAQFECYRHDIRKLEIDAFLPSDYVIIGGGGLFDVREDFNENINLILNRCYRVFVWGVGFNHHFDREINSKINLKKIFYFGTRDFNSEFEYVPCVSCLNTCFDNTTDETNIQFEREYGIVENCMIPMKEFQFDRISNMASIESVINFIKSSKKIITNSYHAVYWSQLLGNKVILYNPFSSKFDGLKIKPVLFSGNLEKDFSLVKTDLNFLKESRNLNIQFKDKLLNYIRSF